MEELRKHLRPGRLMSDQFFIASCLSFLILLASSLVFPFGMLLIGTFEKILGGDHDAAVFMARYFVFIGIWIGVFLVILIFRPNRPTLKAVRYERAPARRDGEGIKGGSKNPCGNNFKGLLIGFALGFACNGFCILMSVLMGDVHLEYSGFKLLPFMAFLICVFIQSGAEELLDRCYLYQKLRRRYKAPWIAIAVNSIVFAALHMSNDGISFLAIVQIIAVGILFSLFVYYYNGLWIAMAFHTAWNFTQSIVFGLPNSGIVSAYSVFRLDAASATNGLFYNVNFGVEGSPGAVLILAAACVIVYIINRGKDEYTDIWDEADKRALEKAAAKAKEDALTDAV